MLRRRDLRKRIESVIAKNEDAEFMLMIDYCRSTFYEKEREKTKMQSMSAKGFSVDAYKKNVLK